MKKFITYGFAMLLALALAFPANAACYADYKAKQDKPLRLHYGVVKVPDPVCQNHDLAEKAVKDRIDKGGWTLLNVLSVFGKNGLDKRKTSAGKFFLRF